MRERSLALHRKKDRSDLTLFIPFLLVHDYHFDDPNSLKYICQGFQFFYIYIRAESYRSSHFKEFRRLCTYILVWQILYSPSTVKTRPKHQSLLTSSFSYFSTQNNYFIDIPNVNELWQFKSHHKCVS